MDRLTDVDAGRGGATTTVAAQVYETLALDSTLKVGNSK